MNRDEITLMISEVVTAAVPKIIEHMSAILDEKITRALHVHQQPQSGQHHLRSYGEQALVPGPNSYLRMGHHQQSSHQQMQYGQPPFFPMLNDNHIFLRALSTIPMMIQKSKSAVIVNYPNVTEEQDRHLVEQVCEGAGLKLAENGPRGLSSVHRHASVEEKRGGKKSRILKVHFNDIYTRDKFLQIFDSKKPADMSYVYARRDMTVGELSIDRELRAICYSKNEAEGGGRRWVVGDLALIDRGPRPGNQGQFYTSQRGRGGFRGGRHSGGTNHSVRFGTNRSTPADGQASSSDYLSTNSENP